MKPKKSFHFPTSLVAAGALAIIPATGLQAQTTHNWIGGATTGQWGASTNWSGGIPNSANANVFFYTNATQLNTHIVSGRTIGSLTFNDNADSNVTIRLTTANIGNPVNLTMGSASIAPSITVTSGADGNHRIGSNENDEARNGVLILANDLAVTHNGTGNLTFNRPITESGGSHGLTKSGTGTMILARANNYTGATTINTGTLALRASGSIANSSGVALGGGTFDVSAVADGYTLGKLSGSGTVVGALTVSTELSIGSSPGTINFNSLSLESSTSYLFGLDGGGSAAGLANVSGALGLGDATLELEQFGTYTFGDKFTLFSYQNGELTGTFDGLPDGAAFSGAGGLWQIDYNDATPGTNGGTGDTFVTITAIPEPSAAVLGAIGLLALLRRRKH